MSQGLRVPKGIGRLAFKALDRYAFGEPKYTGSGRQVECIALLVT